MAAFPLPSYPARGAETEGLLQRLLRKKLEVGAEEWVEKGRERGRGVFEGLGAGGEGLVGEEGLWAWAGMEANRVARGYRWGGVGGEEDEGDDEDDGDEDMEEGEGGGGEERDEGATGDGEGGGEMLPVGDVLRFLSTGREATGKV